MYPPRQPRIAKFLKVRVWGMDSGGKPVNQEASTLNISEHGVRLSGVCCWNAPGEIIGLRYLSQKARYRIVWVGSPGSALAGQIGLQCVDEGKAIWGDALPAAQPAQAASTPQVPRPQAAASLHASGGVAAPPPARSGADHRRSTRFNCKGGVRVQEIQKGTIQYATLGDISMGGCYIETVSPLPPTTIVDLRIDMSGLRVETGGEVKITHPNVGMGVEFRSLRATERAKLQAMVSSIAQQSGKGAGG